MLSWFVSIGEGSLFGVKASAAALAAIRYPRDVLYQMYTMLVGALPLSTVAGLALGAVIWMHTHAVLARTGTEHYLPTLLAVAVVLELAPLGAGLIVAARTGAFLGAELGAMRISEQVDALEILGVSPMARLVGPRILACILMMPILDVFIATLAILTGFAADQLVNGTSWLAYQSAFLSGRQSELYLAEVLPAVAKTCVFGLLIGIAGCYAGLTAKGGTEGVGLAATQGVVTASLLVLAADVVLVGLIQVIW